MSNPFLANRGSSCRSGGIDRLVFCVVDEEPDRCPVEQAGHCMVGERGAVREPVAIVVDMDNQFEPA